MAIIRFLIILFNVGVVTFLIYRLFAFVRQPVHGLRKWVVIATGILLLIVPFAFLFRIIPVSIGYFLLYPVAVSLFIYMIRE
jgi:hypothetical protein